MENKYFRYSTVVSPLITPDTNSLLYDVDPVMYRMLQFFQGIIGLHCGARWDIEVAKAGRSDLIGKVVNQLLPYDPLPLAEENQFRFPLLAMYTVDEEYEWKTTLKDHIIVNVELIYMLPPLTSDQMEQLYPFVKHVAKTLNNRTKEGSDSAFNSQEQVWIEAGLEQIGFDKSEYGKIPGLKSNMFFPAVSMKIRYMERTENTNADNLLDYEGLDARVKLHNPEGCDCDVVILTTES